MSVCGRQDMGGGEDTLVGRADVIPDGDGPIYVSPDACMLSLSKPRCANSLLLPMGYVCDWYTPK